VESPAKAKTIEKYLGSDFVVKSSYGHIRDLQDGDSAIDVQNNYEVKYEVSNDKKKLVAELKKACKSADEVWLATDEDREGEAISWHLCEVLGLDVKQTKRIVFNEITKSAIQKAVKAPRTLDLHLVDAQQARRVLDRLVGFELSPILWRKIAAGAGLSAGRVQSVAVRLIVEREREIRAHKESSAFKVTAIFEVKDKNNKTSELKAELDQRFKNEDEAYTFLQDCIHAGYTISNIEVKPSKRTPAAPFTTSTLQQEASRKLGFSVSRTMLVAQNLYESGHITYMRTDSVNLSDTALESAAKAINSAFGKQYHQLRKYKNKNESAQEAHEAIRPTDFNASAIDGDRDQMRLYELIWKRAIASQMSDAILEKTNVSIDISSRKEKYWASGEIIQFDGFLKVYIEGNDDEAEDEEKSTLLPPLHQGQQLIEKSIVATERYTRPAPRYTEASLVKKLEELGIGRPSTYAPTISTIQKRNYVLKDNIEGRTRDFQVLTLANHQIKKSNKQEITGADKGKLHPSDTGFLVNDFLTDNFKQVMDYGFTASIEGEFDQIASGKLKWKKMIDSFYKPFHQNVETTLQQAERVTGERDLGIDPVSGKKVVARMARYGPVFQLIGKEDEKPEFRKLPTGKTLATVTLEDLYKGSDFPKNLGQYEGQDVSVNTGRFGPYVKLGATFASIPKNIAPLEIELEQAIELIKAKQEKDANKLIQSWEKEGISIQVGRWGPFIKRGKDNYKIPKGTEAKNLTLDEVMALIEQQGGGKSKTSKTTSKKTTTKKK